MNKKAKKLDAPQWGGDGKAGTLGGGNDVQRDQYSSEANVDLADKEVWPENGTTLAQERDRSKESLRAGALEDDREAP